MSLLTCVCYLFFILISTSSVISLQQTRVNETDNIVRRSTTPFYMFTLPRALVPQHQHWLYIHVDRPRVLVSAEVIGIRGSERSSATPKRVLRGGRGRLSIRLPFTNYAETHIGLGITIYDCTKAANDFSCLKKPGPLILRQWKRIRVIKRPLLLYVDADRPVYRPGELVRFRVIAVFADTLRPSDPGEFGQRVHFNRIYLESANQLRVAEWRNVTWMDAFKGLRQQLTTDAVHGTWRIVAEVDSIGEQQALRRFEVMNYAPPKVIVEAKPPDFLRSTARSVAFSVCARSSAGQPIKARVAARFCVRSKRYPLPDSPCLHVESELKGRQDCVYFNESAKPLRLHDLPLPPHSSAASATRYTFLDTSVTVRGDNSFVSRSVYGGRLVHFVFDVELRARDIFEPGLPFYLSVLTKDPDGEPYANGRVRIEVRTVRKKLLVYIGLLNTNKKGRGSFVIPPGLLRQPRHLIRAISVVPNSQRQQLRPSTAQILVTRASSPSDSHLQIVRLPDHQLRDAAPVSPCSQRHLRVRLQSTVPLHAQTVHVLLMSGGDIYASVVSRPPSTDTRAPCRHQDSPDLGHYRCVRRRPSDGRWLVRCRVGWHGPDCLTPVCSDGCVRGVCVSPDRCHCQAGWRGRSCNRCVRHRRCRHGYCHRGDDCACLPGWSGPFCDRMSFQTAYRLLRPAPESLPRRVPYPSRRRLQVITVARRDLSLRLDRPLGPATHLAAFVRVDDRHELLAAALALSGASRCLSERALASFRFRRPVARPGEEVRVRLAVRGASARCALSIRDAVLETLDVPRGLTVDHVRQEIARALEERRRGGARTEPTGVGTCAMAEEEEEEEEKKERRRRAEEGAGPSRGLTEAGVHLLSNALSSGDPCDDRSDAESWRKCEAEEEGRRSAQDAAQLAYTPPDPSVFKPLAAADAAERPDEELKRALATHWPPVWRFGFIERPRPSLALLAPRTLTTWQAQLVCLSSAGLSVAPTATLVVYQPFLVLPRLPPAGVVVGETLSVPVLVRSYTSDCIELRLRWRYSKFFVLRGADSLRMCLCEFGERKLNFTLTPRNVGRVQLRIETASRPTDNCRPKQDGVDAADIIKDVVQRHLLVRKADPNVLKILSSATNADTGDTDVSQKLVEVPFEMKAHVSSNAGSCAHRQLKLCLRNRSPDIRAVMLVAKVKMASGWSLSRGTVAALKRSSRGSGLRVVRTDAKGTLILLYDFYSTFHPRCAGFSLTRHFLIANLKPMLIELFDFSLPEAVKRHILTLETPTCPPVTLSRDAQPSVGRGDPRGGTIGAVGPCPLCRLDKDTLAVLLESICEMDREGWSLMTAHYMPWSAKWRLTALGEGQLERWSGAIRVPRGCHCSLSRRLLLVARDERVSVGRPVLLNGRWSVVDASRLASNMPTLNMQGVCRSIIETIV